MRHSWLLLLACLAGTGQAAGVYQYIDEHGNRVFTDKPPLHVDAEEVRLPEVNRTQMPSPAAPSGSSQTAPADDNQVAPPYRQLAIVDLPEQATFRANDGNIEIHVQTQPRLAMQHRLQLLVDGQPHGEASRSVLLRASNLDRGEHSIAVQVVSGDKVLQQSPAYQINIQRTHINAPARRGP